MGAIFKAQMTSYLLLFSALGLAFLMDWELNYYCKVNEPFLLISTPE